MGINLDAKSVIKQSKEFPVLTGDTITAEGIALVQAFENGIEKVKLSAGSSAEIFMGFSYGEVFTPLTKSLVENGVVPASSPYTITVTREPISGQLFIYDETGSVEITAGNPTNLNEYSISGKVVTFNVGKAGAAIRFQYRYAPTALDLMYDDKISTYTPSTATDFLNQIGCIQHGEVWIDQFNAAINWENATAVKVNTNGILTDQTGAGVEIPNSVITSFPTEEEPFLGIRF